jgi:GNAT superfamily N-acetyltransferase
VSQGLDRVLPKARDKQFSITLNALSSNAGGMLTQLRYICCPTIPVVTFQILNNHSNKNGDKMFKGFRGSKIREANTLSLCWKVYWLFFGGERLLVMSGIALLYVLGVLIFSRMLLKIMLLAGIPGNPQVLTEVFDTSSLVQPFFFGVLRGFVGVHIFLFLCICLMSLSSRYHKTWVLEKKGKLIAAVVFEFRRSHSTLMFLEVARSSRGQGFGSHLMQQLYPHVGPKPIYVVPRPQVIDFYQKNGFSICSPQQCPGTLRYSYRKVLVRR